MVRLTLASLLVHAMAMSVWPAAPEHLRLPFMIQGWCDLTAIHWAYEPRAIAPHVPRGLELETFEGKAWVGVFPFRVDRNHLPYVPPAPWISTFPETNLRTYVRAPDGSTGVWFFSLDAGRLLPVVGARSLYRLPYMWSEMSVERAGSRARYRGSRKWPGPGGAGCRAEVDIGTAIPPDDVSELAVFLMARWRLYTFFGTEMYYAQVEHDPWPLHHATLRAFEQDLTDAAGLPRPEGDPLVVYSPGVVARISFVRPVPVAVRDVVLQGAR